MAFCFSSSLEIAILFAKTNSELSPSFYLLSFAILLTFLSLFVSKLIAHKSAAASQVLEKTAIIVAATALVLGTTIPFSSNKPKRAAWALYAASLLTIFICNFKDETVKLKRFCPTASTVICFLKKYVCFSQSWYQLCLMSTSACVFPVIVVVVLLHVSSVISKLINMRVCVIVLYYIWNWTT